MAAQLSLPSRIAGLAFAAVLTVLAAGSLTVGSSAARADDAQVTVVTAGGSQRPLSLQALAGSEDIVSRAYALRSDAGESTQSVTGFSLGKVLEAAGADPIGFSYLEVQRPAGGSVLLSRHQALDPGAFAEGAPVVYATATGTGFLRPSSGPEDLNATDSFEAPQGITITLSKGSPLQVRAKASTVRTKPGQKVEFTAVVERAGSGEQLSYSWYFDDGLSGEGARTSHRFQKRGSYDVVVGVTTPGDDTGASAVVTVQVGPPLSGPDRKGGGSNPDAGAPDHGAAGGSSGATPPSAGSATPAVAAAPTPPAPNRTAKQQAQKPSGEEVSGLLLSSSPAPEPTASPAARTGKLSEQPPGGGIPATAWGLLVTAGLLGLGALAEARGAFVSLSGAKAPWRSA